MILIFFRQGYAGVPQDFRGDEVLQDKVLAGPDYCSSTKEFKTAYEFFLLEKDFPLSNREYLRLALEISKGCTGAAGRFNKVYSLLKISGVDLRKSIEAGIKFSKMTDQQAHNFVEIFPQIYLKEFYDLDFWVALNVSLRLAEFSKGPVQQIRNDFTKITKFCLNDTSMELPVKNCAELALFLAEQSQYFPTGVADPFIEDFKYLRKDKKLGLSIRASIKILRDVFAYGPMAPKNFKDGLEYALSSKGLNIKVRRALSLAVNLARVSSRNLPPPVFEEDATKK